ncbi:MAG: protein-L-isoaspartate(D-aspartate) O-methyltransferase [Candidatus Kapabacteria bacterium]|nr:protein-L-isoaspartate(D-aspartate) O-methyltransferase [Ignavibacteriota bacterium]MCW5883697.1 protein-L-isoaspartate(D-aspartate) O-methyltransferase [Candidatus Kapabacteria bacterium]
MTNEIINNFLKLNPQKREFLVSSLRNKGISELTLSALNSIPREYFLKKSLWDEAYDDKALPIDFNQTISQPATVGLMTDLLEIEEGSKVLEIGTGSCYQALILSYLGAEVFTVERIENLKINIEQTFKDFPYKFNYFFGDGTSGLVEYAPYDRIIVTAGSPEIPTTLLNQLKIEGIIVIPVGDKNGQTMKKVIKLSKDQYDVSQHGEFRFVPLLGLHGWSY